MTNKEALHIVANPHLKWKCVEVDSALTMVRNALDKQTAIPHHHTRIDHINDSIRVSVCPDCLGLIYTFKDEYPNFCTQCGQKIDWKE